ncbi:MAG: hypothetical protein JXQ96_13655 [Cyclobacteriaceae bacterium]
MTEQNKAFKFTHLTDLFQDEEDFVRHMNNLRQVTTGLWHIYETREDLKESILPQLLTIGGIYNALVTDRSYNRYEDSNDKYHEKSSNN